MNDPWWSEWIPLEWIPLQAFLGLWLIYGVLTVPYLVVVNHDVIEARMWPGKGTESWDWVWSAVFFPLSLGVFVVAWLDVDSGGTPLPLWTWPLGVVLFVLGGGMFTRAMGENPFFEKTVRIQTERDHHVINTGPYRVVRHPGYVGMEAWILSFPLLLTSAWALLPAVLAMISLGVRAAFEDRTLQEKLPGYADYAQRVRFRLIPGVW